MTTKERLHRLVDVLPEAERVTAARVFEALGAVATRDPSDRAARLAAIEPAEMSPPAAPTDARALP